MFLLIFLFLFSFSFYKINAYSNSFCGSNLLPKFNKTLLKENLALKSNKNITKNSKKRKLLVEYTPINIVIDNKYMLYQRGKDIISVEKYTLISESLQKAATLLSSLVSVEKNNKKITLNRDRIINNCDLGNNLYDSNNLSPNPISSNTIIIYPRFHDFKQNGNNNILSSAKFCELNEDNRPVAGFIYIEQNITDLEMRKTNIEKYYTMIFLHELTHILIFDIELFQESGLVNKIVINQIERLKQNRTIISSTNVLKKARRHFGCNTIKGIELENQDYDYNKQKNNENNDNFYDKFGNHWDARTMLTDYMTSIKYDEVVISEITLALFEDSGWYKVNYYTGGLFRYGKNQGCDFLNSYCVYGDISKHGNDFCIKEGTTMCTPGRTHRGMCGIMTYPTELDIYYRYFTDSRKGGYLSQTDYCPVAKTNSSISKTYFYQGHCNYGEIELFPENLGYEMGENSICLLSSLTPKDDENLKEYPSSFRALCYRVKCYNENNEKSLIIYIGNNVIYCPRSGGTQTLEGYNGFILCPDYNLICTGKVWCLDPITCIEKKSLAKDESFEYDYIISTSQEYKDLLNYKVPVEDKVPSIGKYLSNKKILFYFMIFMIFFLL